MFSTEQLVAIFFGLCSLVTSGCSVFIALRALRHQRSKDVRVDIKQDTQIETELVIAVRELRNTLTDVIAESKENAERFREHDKTCAASKAEMAANLAQTTKALEHTVDVVENLQRQFVYLARDVATRDTEHKLGLRTG